MIEEAAETAEYYYVSRLGGPGGRLQSIRVNSVEAAVSMAAVDLRTSLAEPVEVRAGEAVLFDYAALLDLIERRRHPR